MKREKYAKYGDLLLSSLTLLFGVALLIVAREYMSIRPIQQGALFSKIIIALCILAFAILSAISRARSLRKSNDKMSRKLSEAISSSSNSFVDYLKSTYYLHLSILIITAIILMMVNAFFMPWLGMKGLLNNESIIYLYFAIIGSVMVLVALSWIVFILFRKN